MRELNKVEVQEVSGGLVWTLVATFGTAYVAGYAKGTYDKWRDSMSNPVDEGGCRPR